MTKIHISYECIDHNQSIQARSQIIIPGIPSLLIHFSFIFDVLVFFVCFFLDGVGKMLPSWPISLNFLALFSLNLQHKNVVI